MRPRVIPVLLLSEGGLVKTIRFKKPNYLGDPINAIRLYNEMEVDELVVLDIQASKTGQPIDLDYLQQLASEAFMPLAYGGGVTTLEGMAKILRSGFEKVVCNCAFIDNPELLSQAAQRFGAQSVVAAIDVKKSFFGKPGLYHHVRKKILRKDLWDHVAEMVDRGAGELFLNSVDQDGRMEGYDLDLIGRVAQSVEVPLVVCGGAGSLEDMSSALERGAHACAAGSLFVYQGRSRGILINYPGDERLKDLVKGSRSVAEPLT